ncbi:MAG: T9SS type A sorting domain-containing protein [Bacteroidia bacterium]|nr:T9SS type A sorting domain-containing protein [Bacteroidia bacterium]
MKKIYFYILALTGLSVQGLAQIVGGNCYLERNFVQMAVGSCGTYGVSAIPPAGYYPNVTGRFGFIADPPRNGWTVAGPGTFPNYMGDYFTPGSPEEGWGIEFNIGATNYNYGTYQLCGTGLGDTGPSGHVPGGIVAYNTTPTSRQAVWQGSVMGLQITQTTTIFTDSLYILTCVRIQNNSPTTTFSNVYYMRNVDPDNEQPWTGDFTTTNTIVYQQPMSSGSRALVSAVGLTHSAYIGLGTKDTRARVTYGGFSNRDPSDIWNFVGFTGTIGSTNTSDIAISIAFNLGNIPPGGCAELAYVYVLSAAQLESALNATSPTFIANGKDITTSGSITIGDCDRVELEIVNGTGNCYDGTTWNWTWSPATGLSSTSGTSIIAAPTTTTTYTVTATDNCGAVVYVQEIQIIVAPPLSVSVPATYHYCGSPVSIDATVSGGAPFTLFACNPATSACSGPQNTYTVGTGTITNGTTGYPNPYGNARWGAKHQFLIRASELTAAGLTPGNIDRISFNVQSTNGVTYNNFTISIGCTKSSTLSGFVTGLTPVYGPVNYVPTVGWNDHIFTTPYYWDGSSNLIVETCFNNSSATQNSPVFCTNMGYNCSVQFYQNSSTVCSNTSIFLLSNIRPNMRFRHCPTPPSTYFKYNWSPSTGLSCSTCEDPFASPPTTPITYTVTVTDASGCTATASTTILPCLPTGFTLEGKPQNQNVILSWLYPNDLSFKHFEVERSTDGLNYQKIATLKPANDKERYEYLDTDLRAGSYKYRIRKVNKDGSDTYSNTVEITIYSTTNGFTLQSIAPNPAYDAITIQYELTTAGNVEFSIYDLTGRKLKTLYDNNVSTGQYAKRVSVSDLPNGNYLIAAIFNGHTQHFRLSVVR